LASTGEKLKSFTDAADLKIGGLPEHPSRCHLTTTNPSCLEAIRQFDFLKRIKIRAAMADVEYCETSLNAGIACRRFNA
jgi:hypothetical protein